MADPTATSKDKGAAMSNYGTNPSYQTYATDHHSEKDQINPKNPEQQRLIDVGGAVSPNRRSCLSRCRRSPAVVLIVVTVALLVDRMCLSSLLVILPEFLRTMESALNDSASLGGAGNDNASLGVTANYSTRRVRSIEDFHSREVGIILGVHDGTAILAQFFAGALVLKFGFSFPFVAGLLLTGAGVLIYALAATWWLLVVANVVLGVATSITTYSAYTMLATVFQDKTKRIFAYSVAYNARLIGNGLGYSAGAFIYDWLGRRAPFWTLLGLVGLDMLMRLFAAIPTGADERPEDLPNSTNSDEQKSESSVRKFLTVVKSLFSKPPVVVLLLLDGIWSISNASFVACVPIWMLGTLGATLWQLGTIKTISLVTCALSALLGGLAIAKSRNYRWLYAWLVLIAQGAAFLIFPFSGGIWQSLGPELLMLLSTGLFAALFEAWLTDVADSLFHGRYETVLAVGYVIHNCGLILGETLSASVLLPRVGFQYLMFGLAALNFVHSFSTIYLRKLTKT